MKWSVLFALVLLAMAAAGVFNEVDRCGRSTDLAWTYCESIQPVR